MEDKYNTLIRQSSDYKKQREDKYKEDSKDRLSKIIKTKLSTTMIGAIASLEEHFGFLWNNPNGESPSPEQEEMKRLFLIVRSEILDKGNNQSRNIDVELSNYEIEWKKFRLTLPVRPGKEKNNEKRI